MIFMSLWQILKHQQPANSPATTVLIFIHLKMWFICLWTCLCGNHDRRHIGTKYWQLPNLNLMSRVWHSKILLPWNIHVNMHLWKSGQKAYWNKVPTIQWTETECGSRMVLHTYIFHRSVAYTQINQTHTAKFEFNE